VDIQAKGIELKMAKERPFEMHAFQGPLDRFEEKLLFALAKRALTSKALCSFLVATFWV
jgi:hypothetical protein